MLALRSSQVSQDSELDLQWESWSKYFKSQSNSRAKRTKIKSTGNDLLNKVISQVEVSTQSMLSGKDSAIMTQ